MPEIHVTDEQGVEHIFPDGATPEMIAKTLNVKAPATTSWFEGTLSGTAPWQKAIDQAAQTEAYSTDKGLLGNAGAAIKNLGAGAVGLLFEPAAHPLKTVAGLMPDLPTPTEVRSATPVPWGKTGADLTALVPGAVLAKAAAPVAADAAEAGMRGAGKMAVATGEAAQDAGTGLMNKTVGTLKSDFKRGANPARGYLETGNGPSISMHSIADKAATALEDTGKKLGDAYQQATASGAKVPIDVVAQEMAKPLQKAIDLETGPGGTGNLASIQSYIQQFSPAFDKAAQNGGFTPSELFEMKRSIAQNTNWSDPAQFNLKAVRQQQAGALSGILSDAVPETAPLNQTYQDLLKMQARAQERANTGSRPLTSHIYKAGMTAVGALAGGMEGKALLGAAVGAAMDTVPVKTTIASGLFRGGKAMAALGDRLSPAEGASMVDVPPNNLGGNGAQYKARNPQLAPPENSNFTTTSDRWAARGADNVMAHVENDPSSGLTTSDIAEAAKSPHGRQLLIQASSLKPGSAMMTAIVKKIPQATTQEGLLPSSSMGNASWVAVEKATGKAVMETFSKKTAAAINRDKYDVIPIGEYLGNLNKTTK